MDLIRCSLVLPITGQGGVFAIDAVHVVVAAAPIAVMGIEMKGRSLKVVSHGLDRPQGTRYPLCRGSEWGSRQVHSDL